MREKRVGLLVFVLGGFQLICMKIVRERRDQLPYNRLPFISSDRSKKRINVSLQSLIVSWFTFTYIKLHIIIFYFRFVPCYQCNIISSNISKMYNIDKTKEKESGRERMEKGALKLANSEDCNHFGSRDGWALKYCEFVDPLNLLWRCDVTFLFSAPSHSHTSNPQMRAFKLPTRKGT